MITWTEHLEYLEEAARAVNIMVHASPEVEAPENIADMLCVAEAVLGEIWEFQEGA